MDRFHLYLAVHDCLSQLIPIPEILLCQFESFFLQILMLPQIAINLSFFRNEQCLFEIQIIRDRPFPYFSHSYSGFMIKLSPNSYQFSLASTDLLIFSLVNFGNALNHSIVKSSRSKIIFGLISLSAFCHFINGLIPLIWLNSHLSVTNVPILKIHDFPTTSLTSNQSNSSTVNCFPLHDSRSFFRQDFSLKLKVYSFQKTIGISPLSTSKTLSSDGTSKVNLTFLCLTGFPLSSKNLDDSCVPKSIHE